MTDPELTYYGEVTYSGEIRLPKKMRAELEAAFRGKRIRVRFDKQKRRTTDSQREYYFAVIVQSFLMAFRDWSPDVGWTKEGVHEVLKLRFLPLVREWGFVVIPATGEVVKERMSTEKLSTVERELYHEHCRKWGAEMDIIIPLPNEQAEIAFNF